MNQPKREKAISPRSNPSIGGPSQRRPAAKNIFLFLILTASVVGLYVGWKLFWFLTDDAFIAFRYVSNSILGYGYTWNPPPFRPVEGYTSFLWVALLDFVWQVFGVLPPDAANHLSLAFAYLTLTLVVWQTMRMPLRPRLERWRLLLLFFVLLGTLTNRTFLAWTSSGMETAMFNFFLTWWVFTAAGKPRASPGWVLALTGSAVLAYLSRPDGILAVLGSLFLLANVVREERKQKMLPSRTLLVATPLLVAAGHLIWRKSYYGEWLPNTYYAKVVAPWPEAGARYLTSFVLEYALWVWLLVFFILIYPRLKPKKSIPLKKEDKHLAVRGLLPSYGVPLAALALHFLYYTFLVGGDHFEYRVYSHLVPLIFISFVWMLNVLDFKPVSAAGSFALFILFSWPLPWTHWKLTKNLLQREKTHVLIAPLRGHLPSFLGWYAGWFDALQGWLIPHHVCMRHQEHKIFYEYQVKTLPPREEGEKISSAGYPVYATWTVGVPGWVFPHVTVLDLYGLNDYVIARSPYHRKAEVRLMAHDRLPPPGYAESFAPNLFVEAPGRVVLEKRDWELTFEFIRVNETNWKSAVSRYQPGQRDGK